MPTKFKIQRLFVFIFLLCENVTIQETMRTQKPIKVISGKPYQIYIVATLSFKHQEFLSVSDLLFDLWLKPSRVLFLFKKKKKKWKCSPACQDVAFMLSSLYWLSLLWMQRNPAASSCRLWSKTRQSSQRNEHLPQSSYPGLQSQSNTGNAFNGSLPYWRKYWFEITQEVRRVTGNSSAGALWRKMCTDHHLLAPPQTTPQSENGNQQ